jgi:hypothetical protein
LRRFVERFISPTPEKGLTNRSPGGLFGVDNGGLMLPLLKSAQA